MQSQELRQIFVLANAFKEGDLLVGGTRDDLVRDEARRALLGARHGEIRRATLVEDGVSEALARSLDRELHPELDQLTIGQLQRILLGPGAREWIGRHRDGLASEAIAALVKVMTNEELSVVARELFNPFPGDGITVGSPLHFGSRIQPE